MNLKVQRSLFLTLFLSLPLTSLSKINKKEILVWELK